MHKKYRNSIKISNNKKRFVDLSGSIYGKLYLIEPIGVDKNGYTIFKCQCDCGELIYLTHSRIHRNRLKSCGCVKNNESRKGKIPSNIINDPKLACLNEIFSRYKSNSKTRNILFNLTKQDFSNLIFSNCVYCLIKPNTPWKRSNYTYIYNGIDRIDNNKGYIKDNCITACEICNFMKGKLEQNQFLIQIEKIYNNCHG